MKTPALNKSPRSKSRPAANRLPQGFVAELNSSAERAASHTASDSSEAGTISPGQSGMTVFRLEAPSADTVKLVADFTGWDKRPLDLTQAEKGVWRLTVALPPGRYAYRFLVDGEWCDDPACQHCEPNPFGTRNAVIEVA